MTHPQPVRPTRCSQVNKALAAMGFSEKLVRDPSGYFYFIDGDAYSWPSQSVAVYRISDLTTDEWLSEHEYLRNRAKEKERRLSK